MAKIVTENIVISISRIVKNLQDTSETGITEELLRTLESVSQELVGEKFVVEVSVVDNE
jgi:hypothetical protein